MSGRKKEKNNKKYYFLAIYKFSGMFVISISFGRNKLIKTLTMTKKIIKSCMNIILDCKQM